MPRLTNECWPNRAFCQIHNHGGIAQGNSSFPGQRSSSTTGAGLFVYQRSTELGSYLETVGDVMMARSVESMPRTKEWTHYTKRQHKEIRLTSPSNPMASRSVKSKDFDYMPARHSRSQEMHQRRRPLVGTRSRTSKARIKLHRSRKFSEGLTVKGTGKLLPLLGAGFYGYDLAQSDDPYRKIVRDAAWVLANPLEFTYEASGAGTLQRATYSGEQQRVRNIEYRTEFLKSLWPF